ncbi:glycoside hydrolase family 2 TIM barrel-domain containing protein [Balneolales bacterium ANBcel1]|nr:glycoside hydrolase family 2 TIM barrel-domain containing protein [Balneolales bacterium ANBcel1]
MKPSNVRTTAVWALFIVFILTGFACSGTTEHSGQSVPVTLEQDGDGNYTIYRDGEPYFIKGAGGSSRLDMLVETGGNSIRTWSTDDAGRILDEAHERGLSVMLGIWLQHERHGFNYDDEEAVARQKNEAREKILRYRDHPALLAWGLGNEVNLQYSNTRVWHAVEDIAQMARELAPNQLVTTVIAGIDQEIARLVTEKVPSIDFLSINTYGGLDDLPQRIRETAWDGPYAVTEWGPTGHWQVDRTGWDVPIEPTSTEKAAQYLSRYQNSILGDPDRCLGSYTFLWGQKQETTPTWYGVFLETGEITEVVDVMHYNWTGEWPELRAPSIHSITIDGLSARDDIYLSPGGTYMASVEGSHPNNSSFEIRWEFLPESTDVQVGGDHEERPETIFGLEVENKGETLVFRAPEQPGPYRLFVYLVTEDNRAATANIPFFAGEQQ